MFSTTRLAHWLAYPKGVLRLTIITSSFNKVSPRFYSNKPVNAVRNKYQVVVVGGGAGGCSSSARLCRALPGAGKVAVVEPADSHAYQPLWTLVGGGVADISDTLLPMSDALPDDCDWIKDKAVKFKPDENLVITSTGHELYYDYLMVAMGIQLNYGAVPGLEDALKNDPQVCSNYLPEYCVKTHPAIKNVTSGNAIFTFPNTPIKCAGAPQKIMYLAEEYFRESGNRDQTQVIFNTSLGVIFGVKKYAEALSDVIKRRNIQVNHRMNLVEVRHDRSEAVFENLDNGEKKTFKYSLLHAVPPMSPPDVLKSSPLADQAGWLDLNKLTLQHNTYHNVFGLGDCSSLPTAKTAAAVASQNKIAVNNLLKAMHGSTGELTYDGYTSCPLITGRGKCILAEFDYNAQPLETFPVNQGVERRSMYLMKKDFMPRIYWQMLLKGRWGGPKIVRKLTHLGMSK